jgi:hypothetical protein
VGTDGLMFDPTPPATPPAAPGAGSNASARYSYLTSRLRSRQITMEEATELFGIMQGMLARSELSRQALMAASRTRGLTGTAAPAAASAPTPPSVPGSGDEMLLFGLLALGAGTGLVAALAKRIQDGPTLPPVAPKSNAPAK